MTLEEVKSFLIDAKDFFVKLDEYLQHRAEGMVKGARGNSRFVSLWEGMIGQHNVRDTLDKICNYLETLPVNDEFETLDRATQIINYQAYQNLVAKTANYLHRAQELLEILNFNTQKSLAFLPVHAHKSLAEKLSETFTQCSHVLAKHGELIQQSTRRVNKSWLTQELHYDSLMVAARATAFGLSKSTQVYPGVPKISEEQALANYAQALTFFNEIATEIEKVATKDARPTKITRKLLGCEDAVSPPHQSSVHWQYCPKGVSGKMQQLKDLIKAKAPSKDLTQAEVDEAIKVEFPPEPKTPYGLR